MPDLLLEYEISKQRYRDYLEKLDNLQRDQQARASRAEAQYRLLMGTVKGLVTLGWRLLIMMRVSHKDEYQTNYQQR
jgi:hypothetical protein